MPVTLVEPRDHAWVYVDGRRVGSCGRSVPPPTLQVPLPEQGGTLDILVENRGRSNFFWRMEDNRKGLTRGVVLNQQQFQHGWEMYCLPLTDLRPLVYQPPGASCAYPAFFSAALQVDEPHDTFLRVTPGCRGVCWINGFNLGRYDNQGPQFTLYVPAPLLRHGENRLEVLELERFGDLHVDWLERPEW